MALGPTITIGSTVYSSLDNGIYIQDTATLDEPTTLEIQPKVVAGKESSLTVRIRERTNSVVVGAPDDEVQYFIGCRGPQHKLSEANVMAKFAHLNTFIQTAGVAKRILRNEK